MGTAWIVVIIILLLIVGGWLIYLVWFKPKCGLRERMTPLDDIQGDYMASMEADDCTKCRPDVLPTDFVHKKRVWTTVPTHDEDDMFDIDKMLPKQRREDWFDTDMIMDTKQIEDSNLIHPSTHLGRNTVGTSRKNATTDIRGDIPIPKVMSPWGMSTIESGNLSRGLRI